MTTVLEYRLTRAGRVVGRCPIDGTVFDVHTTYRGTTTNAIRDYCSTSCRRDARNLRAAALREHRRRYADLIARHAEEDAGQLPLEGCPPLPPIPELPKAVA